MKIIDFFARQRLKTSPFPLFWKKAPAECPILYRKVRERFCPSPTGSGKPRIHVFFYRFHENEQEKLVFSQMRLLCLTFFYISKKMSKNRDLLPFFHMLFLVWQITVENLIFPSKTITFSIICRIPIATEHSQNPTGLLFS